MLSKKARRMTTIHNGGDFREPDLPVDNNRHHRRCFHGHLTMVAMSNGRCATHIVAVKQEVPAPFILILDSIAPKGLRRDNGKRHNGKSI